MDRLGQALAELLSQPEQRYRLVGDAGKQLHASLTFPKVRRAVIFVVVALTLGLTAYFLSPTQLVPDSATSIVDEWPLKESELAPILTEEGAADTVAEVDLGSAEDEGDDESLMVDTPPQTEDLPFDTVEDDLVGAPVPEEEGSDLEFAGEPDSALENDGDDGFPIPASQPADPLHLVTPPTPEKVPENEAIYNEQEDSRPEKVDEVKTDEETPQEDIEHVEQLDEMNNNGHEHGTTEEENPPNQQDRRLVILVPANKPNPNLCKFMFSAIALGFPSPIIVNWGRDPYEMSKWEGGPNLSKISGIMRYLDAVLHQDAHPFEKLNSDDIVVIADGFDVWFQLPPKVLLERFHAINDRANARLREQWDHDEDMPMKQSIVVAAQKRCWPSIEEGANLHCDELPESPLRKDLFGPDTDVFLDEHTFSNFRPRYINGGVYIGEAGALRRMFRRAYDKVDSETSKGVHLFSEQGVSGEVLGEQETWRNWRRKASMAGTEALDLVERDFEYHIGLDYAQELSYPTCHSERDGWVVPLNRQDIIDQHAADRGIDPVRVHGVPETLRAVQNPLEGLVETPDWGDMPMYVDFWSQTLPVILHHNAWKDDLKQRRVWWWDQMWFFPHLRDLLARRLEPGPRIEPLASVLREGYNITYFASHPEDERKRPRLLQAKAFEPLGEIDWDAICRDPEEEFTWEKHWWDEVFRDDKGPL